MPNSSVRYRRLVAIGGWLSLQLGWGLPTQAQSSQLAPANHQLAPICASQLPLAISQIVDRPELRRYRWGIVVRELDRPNQLYNRDGDRLFIPASNVKLITTAVALRQLSANLRLRTSVYRLSTANTTNLLVVGRGDPSLTTVQLDSIAQQLRQRGIRQIGQLRFDDGYFRGAQLNGDWEWSDLATDYAPAINGLMLGQNTQSLTLSPERVGMPLRASWGDLSLSNWQLDNQTLTTADDRDRQIDASAIFGRPTLRLTGTLARSAPPLKLDLPVLDPAASFVSALRRSLNQAGISVERTQLVFGQDPSALPEVAAIDSPPLGALITETNQNSNNVYAEVLLRSIGRTHPQYYTSTDDTSTLGIAMVKQRLTELGIDPQAYLLRDGSGLSRHNLVAPNAFVQLLVAMAKLPAGRYRDSLPVAGISGSLKNRFKGTIAQGIVSAKTGSMSGVASLSGYINPPQYAPLVFSIIINQHDRSTASIVKVIDEVVVRLARLHRC